MNPFLNPWPPLGSIPVVKNPRVPLTRKERDENGVEVPDGVERPVLYMEMRTGRGLEIHVHPDRWDEFEKHVALANEAMAAKKGQK